MFIRFDSSDGLPSAIYRRHEEILSDISRIKESISEVNERVNLRSLVLDMLSDERMEDDPEYFAAELEQAIREANEAKERLLLLEEELHELMIELRETKWVLGIV